MIIYQRARLHDRPGADRVVEVTTDEGTMAATVAFDPADVEMPVAIVLARTEIEVGVSSRRIAAMLGPWSNDEDPAGPLGLASAPVVVLPDPSLAMLVDAGVRRAARTAIATIATTERFPGLRALELVRDGAEMLLLPEGGPAHLWLARALGGRPLAVLPLAHPAAIGAAFDGLDLDVHVPVPACEEPLRGRIRSALAPLRLEALHHLVEVDPMPAFDELELDGTAADLDQLAAAAAGVLAGRLAVTNRRWRMELDA
jgi:hypothetical protein